MLICLGSTGQEFRPTLAQMETSPGRPVQPSLGGFTAHDFGPHVVADLAKRHFGTPRDFKAALAALGTEVDLWWHTRPGTLVKSCPAFQSSFAKHCKTLKSI